MPASAILFGFAVMSETVFVSIASAKVTDFKDNGSVPSRAISDTFAEDADSASRTEENTILYAL